MKQSRNYLSRVLLLIGFMFVGLVVTSLLTVVLSSAGSGKAAIYGGLVFQDIFVFIVPALVVCLISGESAPKSLHLNRGFTVRAAMAAVVIFALALPAMNWLVQWNAGIKLPSSWAALESSLRNFEDEANKLTQQLLNTSNHVLLVVNLLVVSVMAGLSEETLFRGGMLSPLLQGRRTNHVAVWVVAAVFSAIHIQFFGFVPRMLLGAWLGYLLVWSRSLWLPIFAHALNNAVVVVCSFLYASGATSTNWADAGCNSGSLALASLVTTVLAIAAAVKFRFFKPAHQIVDENNPLDT